MTGSALCPCGGYACMPSRHISSCENLQYRGCRPDSRLTEVNSLSKFHRLACWVAGRRRSSVCACRRQDAVHPDPDGLRRLRAGDHVGRNLVQRQQQLLGDAVVGAVRRDEFLDRHLHHGRRRAAARQRRGESSQLRHSDGHAGHASRKNNLLIKRRTSPKTCGKAVT